MKNLTRLHYTLISQAVNTFGTFNPEEIFCMFEEQLTPAEANVIFAFLNWTHKNNKSFGHANYKEIYAEFKATKIEKITKKEETMDKQINFKIAVKRDQITKLNSDYIVYLGVHKENVSKTTMQEKKTSKAVAKLESEINALQVKISSSKKEARAEAAKEKLEPKTVTVEEIKPKAQVKTDSKKPVVIFTILKTIRDSKKAVAQSDILNALLKAFPERDATAMTKTIKCQIGSAKRPLRMETEKNVEFKVDVTEKGVKLYSIKK